IADITENNPLDSNIFVFSTGEYIDSLSVGGILKNAEDLAPMEDALVMLYTDTLDSVPLKEKPRYFTRTDKAGKWQLNYLKPGSYKLFALKDANADYLFNAPEEAIAFQPDPISPDGSDSIELRLFQEDVEKQYIKKVTAPFYGQILFVFNRPVEDARIVPIQKDSAQWYMSELFTNKDTLVMWLTADRQLDTLSFLVSDNDSLLDTATVIIPEKGKKTKAGKNRRGEQGRFKVKPNIYQKKVNTFDPLKLQFSHPLKSWDMSGLVFTEGKDTVEFVTSFADSLHRRMRINYNCDEGKQYRLFIPPGAFTDIYGLQNDSIDLNFSTRTEDEFGSLLLKIQGPDSMAAYIIQLLSDKGKVVREDKITGSTVLQYDHLNPGAYKIKLIFDRNGNGQWDTGNYLKQQQPERVIYYSGKLGIRGNWEQETEWTIE
ncbi:MAG: hypothetical protein ACE5DN_07315, partial [Flavobacteriales bacterium]